MLCAQRSGNARHFVSFRPSDRSLDQIQRDAWPGKHNFGRCKALLGSILLKMSSQVDGVGVGCGINYFQQWFATSFLSCFDRGMTVEL